MREERKKGLGKERKKSDELIILIHTSGLTSIIDLMSPIA